MSRASTRHQSVQARSRAAPPLQIADGAALRANSRVYPHSMRITGCRGGVCRFLNFLRYIQLVFGHEQVNLHFPSACHLPRKTDAGPSHTCCTALSSLCGGGQCCRSAQERKIQVGVLGGAAVEGQGFEKGGEGGGGSRAGRGGGGGGSSGNSGGRGDGGDGTGDSAGSGFGWKGWQDRVAFDPEFPFKVLVEQVRYPPVHCICQPVRDQPAGCDISGALCRSESHTFSPRHHLDCAWNDQLIPWSFQTCLH